jgi:hypothetical protein
VEQSELLEKVALTLDTLGAEYAVVGSLASTLYGEPRLTNDIDVVVDLRPEQVDALCNAFPAPEYYLNRDAVKSAVRTRFQFNIIHPASGFKVDCFVAKGDALDQGQLQRAIRVPREQGSYAVRFAAPEDVILKKMEYFRLGESEKHVRDIAGMLKISGDRIDRAYIESWCKQLGLTEIWQAILARVGERDG